MSKNLTFIAKSEPMPTLIASLVFLVPGVGGMVVGPLSYFGYTWVEEPGTGVLIGATCTVWALVGLGVLRFRRWITIDVERSRVERGTRTLFSHPAERFPFDRFSGVEVQSATAGDHVFFVAALAWARGDQDGALWLQTYDSVEPARQAAEQVASATSLPLFDRTSS
ncbi:MAG: hypothetical protein EA397_02135 [Deltaproteobacteria bacterium]|nr:MAG: hypothetical protein EA397_02135 [Deltaproteobacteria bacterium]